MIDDFDIALREECLSDTAVKRRIKPLAKMFFARAKAYSQALDKDDNRDLSAILAKFVTAENEEHAEYTANLSHYIRAHSASLQDMSLGQIAKAKYSYPNFI